MRLSVHHLWKNSENIAKQNGNGHLEKTSVKSIGHHHDIVLCVIREDQDLWQLPIVRSLKGAVNWVNGTVVIKNILSVQKIFNKSNWMYIKMIVRRLTHRVAKAHFMQRPHHQPRATLFFTTQKESSRRVMGALTYAIFMLCSSADRKYYFFPLFYATRTLKI